MSCWLNKNTRKKIINNQKKKKLKDGMIILFDTTKTILDNRKKRPCIYVKLINKHFLLPLTSKNSSDDYKKIELTVDNSIDFIKNNKKSFIVIKPKMILLEDIKNTQIIGEITKDLIKQIKDLSLIHLL